MFPLKELVSFNQKLEDHNSPLKKVSSCAALFHRYFGAAAAAAAKLLQSCLTLCDPTDDSPPGSPAPGILQARKLEWVAISFSNA